MIKASSSLQDLRSGLYGKRKAERPWRRFKASVGSGGVADGESGTDPIGPINLVVMRRFGVAVADGVVAVAAVVSTQ